MTRRKRPRARNPDRRRAYLVEDGQVVLYPGRGLFVCLGLTMAAGAPSQAVDLGPLEGQGALYGVEAWKVRPIERPLPEVAALAARLMEARMSR